MPNSFRTRLIVIFGGLFAVAMVVTFLGVNRTQLQAATDAVTADLLQDSLVFDRSVTVRSGHLLESARLLASDFAFKQAYAINDTGTLESAMGNLMARLEGADVMLLLSLDGEVLASRENGDGEGLPAEEPADTPGKFEPADTSALVGLIRAAEDDDFGEASAIVPFGDRLLQAMLVPLLMPDLEAWVATGFRIDQAFADDFSHLTDSEITVLRRSPDGTSWAKQASTLEPAEFVAFIARESEIDPGGSGEISTLRLAGREFISNPMTLATEPTEVLAILQRPLDRELAPYGRVRRLLVGIFSLAFLLVITGAVFAARSVTRPVLAIAEAAARIELGEFDQTITTDRRDEIGRMAQSFNHMARGLAEKERVRDLLGKVVSPAIAEELLRQKIDLGGEEREVTVLFSDVRSFTSLCEGRSPQEILGLLNLYLTEVSSVISERGGVVDKYIGDAVMALFGAPVAQREAPTNAVLAARDMLAAVERLNPQIETAGWPPLHIGVGINTDVVVAGNMGSRERLNYTVIGDGVNLASRIEGLTKTYGLPILVSEATAVCAESLRFREIDRVRVKGKSLPVGLFEPLWDGSAADGDSASEIDLYHQGLESYRQRSWDRAEQCFASFAEESPRHHTTVSLLLRRIGDLRRNPPPDDWDTTHTFTEK